MPAALDEFLDKVVFSVECLQRCLQSYIENEKTKFSGAVEQTSKAETDADELRRQIELNLFKYDILPYSRGDKVTLLETVDDIADKAEIVAKLLGIYKPKIPKQAAPLFLELAAKTHQTVLMLRDSILALEKNLESAKEKADQTEKLREEARAIEFTLLEKIFSSKEKDLTKITLRDLIALTASIADKAEEASDFVAMLSVKYRG